MWFPSTTKPTRQSISDRRNSTSSTAITSLTTQPANPPPSPPQAANSTFSTFHLESPQPLLRHQYHLQSLTAGVASTPAAPANTSPKAARCPPRKSKVHAPIVLTRPAPSLENNTTPLPSTVSRTVSATLDSNPTAGVTATQIAMYLRLLRRAAVLLHRHHPQVRLRGLLQRVRALVTAMASPGLVRGSSLIAAVMCVAMMRVVIVPPKAKMRSNIAPARQGDRV